MVLGTHRASSRKKIQPPVQSQTAPRRKNKNEEGRKVFAQKEERKSPVRRRIFKPPLFHHFHSAADTGLSACHFVGSIGNCGMENERKVNVPVVKRFVREVVGCTCSDEVFNRVDVKPGSSAIRSCSADYEINVGGRLLIVLSTDPVEAFSPARLEKVMAEGRSARDAGRFNRFRFIVQADNAP